MRMSHGAGVFTDDRVVQGAIRYKIYMIYTIYFIIYYDILLWILLVVLGFSVPVMCSCSAAVA